MLQLFIFFLSLIKIFLLSRDLSEFFLCDSSEFFSVMSAIAIFLLSVTETVIQSELKLFFVFDSVFTAKHVDWLLYVWIVCSLTFCRLLHDSAHAEWASLQFEQQLSFSSFLTEHWSFLWFVSAQNLHFWVNLHILIVWLYYWHW